MEKFCYKCQSSFPSWVTIDGKSRNLSNRKFCLACSPFGRHNTRDLTAPPRPELILCRDCGVHKCATEFHVKSDGRPYPYCKSCHHQRSSASQRGVKQRCVEYKGGRCLLCGYNDCLSALQFHHLDPTQKDFSISEKKNSRYEILRPELDKCILLCNRCHAEVHAGMHPEINRPGVT